MRQKMIELHELPDTESIKSWTNRLASNRYTGIPYTGIPVYKLQSWTLGKTAATTLPCFQAIELLVIALCCILPLDTET